MMTEAWLKTPGTDTWAPKAGCPTTLIRTFNAGRYSGIGSRVYAEITAADGVLYWVLLVEDVKRTRGGYETRALARGQYADIPTALTILKARITRLAMAHVREQLDLAIARTTAALADTLAEHEGIAAAAADLDLADWDAVRAWDRDNTTAAAATDAVATRLERLLALV
jgi:hypothetical protein